MEVGSQSQSVSPVGPFSYHLHPNPIVRPWVYSPQSAWTGLTGMSFKVGDIVLVRWLGKTKGYVQGTTWYNATITSKRSNGRYDVDYQDDIGTVESDVPEIRLIRNVPGDNEYMQQQIKARNEEQKQLLKENSNGVYANAT